MTASSSQSSRSPGLFPNSMPKASCSRSNQAPPMPRTARPPDTWSRVVASLAVSPGFRNVFAPTISPSRTRVVSGPRAASVVQPSRIGCSHGPKMASRWSQVQTESQPAASAASAASRNPGQYVDCDHSCRPNFVVRSMGGPGSVEVVVDGIDGDAEADAVLLLELVVDEPLGLGRVVRVVAARHLRDIGLGGRLVIDEGCRPGQADPAIPVG